MKKLLLTLVAIIMLVFISGCRRDRDEIPDWAKEEITLKYATWQYTNPETRTIDTRMIEEFMLKYPNITVMMDVIGEDYEWDENLEMRLEAENVPDVFLIYRLETSLPSGILADITDLFNSDSDTKNIFASVKNLGMFDGKRYAVPTFIYPKPWYVNLTLLENANINKPSYNWTHEQMIEIAKAVYNPANNIFGLSNGRHTNPNLNDYGDMYFSREYAKVLKIANNSSVGKTWYSMSFDGERFNFLDSVMTTALNALEEATSQGYYKTSFSEEELIEMYNDPAFLPTYGGMVGLWTEFTWKTKDYFKIMNFDWDVYPGPGGVTGGNTDIAGISSLSPHKEAAYELLKWMSFSEEGLLKRFEIYKNEKATLYNQADNYPYPIIDYGLDKNGKNKVWEAIPYGSVAPGFISPQFLEGLRNGAFWINKETVGWDAANHLIQPYFYDIVAGKNSYAAVKEAINSSSNEALEDAVNALKMRLQN